MLFESSKDLMIGLGIIIRDPWMGGSTRLTKSRAHNFATYLGRDRWDHFYKIIVYTDIFTGCNCYLL